MSMLSHNARRLLALQSWTSPNVDRFMLARTTISLRHNSSSSALADSFYDEEQRALMDTTVKLIEREINPHCEKYEKNKGFPAHEVFKKFGNAGLLGVNKPTEFGGAGLSYKHQLAVCEAIGHIRSSGVGMAIGVHTDCSTPALARFGSDELRRNYLAPAVAGDTVSCIGVSEATGGSDVAAIKTTAVKKGDDWVINGSKMWITNGMQADWMCMLANTSDGKPHQNKSLIIVPLDAPGVVRHANIEKMGMNSSDTAILYFEDVKVPVANTIGEEGMGFTYQMLQFQEERLAAAAGILVPLTGLIDETIEYTRSRKAFGMQVLDNQYVHFRLAELKSEVELFRCGVYAAVDAMMRGDDVTMLASMLKLKSGRLVREVTDSCLQFWGGMGFTEENRASRLYRDCRLWSIGGGTDEIMLGVICKLMGILPGKKKSA